MNIVFKNGSVLSIKLELDGGNKSKSRNFYINRKENVVMMSIKIYEKLMKEFAKGQER